MTVVFIPDQAGLASLTAPGGSVYEHVRTIGRDARLLAAAYAPRRRGVLAAGIVGPDMSFSPRTATARVTSTAAYSIYVHDGTQGPIRRPNGRLMPIHNPTRTHVVTYRETVRGQTSQPFLLSAMNRAFTWHQRRRP